MSTIDVADTVITEDALREALATDAAPTAADRAVGVADVRLAGDAQDQARPEQLFDVTAFPIMFALLFTYLFGGALAGSPQRVPAVRCCPASSCMTVRGSRCTPAQALNTDIDKGVFDRFRSLPIWRPAVARRDAARRRRALHDRLRR